MSSFLSGSVLEVLLCGSTAVLALGCVALAMQRSPIHRQRVGEITIAAVIAWLLLTLLPLPRWSPRTLADIKASDFDSSGGTDPVRSHSPHSRPLAPERAEPIADAPARRDVPDERSHPTATPDP